MPIRQSVQWPCGGRGFSLIEVLVSLSILAVGLLGMTALQNEALKYNHAAFTESQAQFLITDMVERIRANAESSTYAIGFTEEETTPSVDCSVNNCSSADMTIWDISEWRSMVEDSAYLSNGESAIQYDPSTNVYTISIRYDWSQLGNTVTAGETRTVTVTTRI